MIPLEFVDEFIGKIKAVLSKEHPLYGKDLFPSAKISRREIYIIENDSNGTLAILNLEKQMEIDGKKHPFTEVDLSRSEVISRIDKDHNEEIESYRNTEEH